ncbi:histone H1-like [Carcharodon carcharias]|uniref:histone H1-like n=1 Tax=Carcharodon carcharias TaxID=13397 RepID=UPI001B7EC732|nr:histone H1-like [Carcharodon carcharias]
MTDTADAETAPPAAPAAQVKTPKKKKKKAAPRSGAAGPKLGEQILKVVADCSDRKGMSLPAIKKALRGKGLDVDKLGSQIKQSIKRNVKNGFLVQVKGTGVSGSFKVPKNTAPGKVGKKAKAAAGKKSPVKKAAAKKVTAKKAAAKKTPVKKASAKKSPVKKAAAKKSPAKKAAAKKTAKKAATPKKPVKKAAPKKKSAKKVTVVKKVAKARAKPKSR